VLVFVLDFELVLVLLLALDVVPVPVLLFGPGIRQEVI